MFLLKKIDSSKGWDFMRSGWHSKEVLGYLVFLSDYITIKAGEATASSPQPRFCWHLRHCSEGQPMPQLAAGGESTLLLQQGLRQRRLVLQRNAIWQVWVVWAEAIDEAELCGDGLCGLGGLLGDLRGTKHCSPGECARMQKIDVWKSRWKACLKANEC